MPCLLATSFAMLGTFPDFTSLEHASLVVMASASDCSFGTPQSDDAGSTVVVKSGKILRGKAGFPLQFTDGIYPHPEAARTILFFLKEDSNGELVAQNPLYSAIPTTVDITTMGPGENFWKKLPLWFYRESDLQCAQFQANDLVFGPPEMNLASEAWDLIKDKKQVPPGLLLPYSVVRFYGGGAFHQPTATKYTKNVATIGVSDDGNMDPLAALARGSIVAWFHRKHGEADYSTLVNYVLQQQGEFQADLLTGIAEHFPADRLPDLAQLLAKTDHILVQYACIQAIYNLLDSGIGIPTVEKFSDNPTPYLLRATELIAKAKDGIGPKKKG